MPAGLSVAIALFAQAATATNPSQVVYGPPPPPPPKTVSGPKPERVCANQNKDPNGNAIVVCAVKPEGYRLPPDIVEARRLKKQGIAGAPRNPHETFADHSCATVGPMGCRGVPTINLLAVAMTAAEIQQRLAKGQEIGSIFQTEKTSSDYKLYLQAGGARGERSPGCRESREGESRGGNEGELGGSCRGCGVAIVALTAVASRSFTRKSPTTLRS